jgi:uncharacterized protein
METLTVLLVGIIIFAASIIEAMTGFGSGIIALPFLASIVGIKTAVPMIMVISVIFTSYMLITNYKIINWRIYITIIIFVALGLPFGIYIFSSLNESLLRLILGIFIIASTVRSLYLMKYPAKENHSKPYSVFQRLMLVGGGVIQGAFATGGPLIVIYSADKLREKSVFRATMSNVWLTLNLILITKNFILGGIMTNRVFLLVAAAFPFFIAGSVIGFKLHNKVSVKTFTLVINIVLLFAGISTIIWVVLK